MKADDMTPIVVGVDGSPASDHALTTHCLRHASVPVVMIPARTAHATPALETGHAADHG